MLRNVLIVLCLVMVLGMVDARVPQVGDHVVVVFNPGLEFTRYTGNITDITSAGIGMNPTTTYQIGKDGFSYLYVYNNTSNASVFIMNNAIAYMILEQPDPAAEYRIPTVLRQ